MLAAGGDELRHCIPRRPALVTPDLAGAVAVHPQDAAPEDHQPAVDPAALIASGAVAVAMLCGDKIRVVSAGGDWRGRLAEARPGAAVLTGGGPSGVAQSRDAMVAGLVPGLVLGWSWSDMLRHAVALTAAIGSAGRSTWMPMSPWCQG